MCSSVMCAASGIIYGYVWWTASTSCDLLILSVCECGRISVTPDVVILVYCVCLSAYLLSVFMLCVVSYPASSVNNKRSRSAQQWMSKTVWWVSLLRNSDSPRCGCGSVGCCISCSWKGRTSQGHSATPMKSCRNSEPSDYRYRSEKDTPWELIGSPTTYNQDRTTP